MSFVGPVTRVGDRLVRPHDVQVLEHPRRGHAARGGRCASRGWASRSAPSCSPPRARPLSAQLSRAEAELLELAEGQIVHVRVEPVAASAA